MVKLRRFLIIIRTTMQIQGGRRLGRTIPQSDGLLHEMIVVSGLQTDLDLSNVMFPTKMFSPKTRVILSGSPAKWKHVEASKGLDSLVIDVRAQALECGFNTGLNSSRIDVLLSSLRHLPRVPGHARRSQQPSNSSSSSKSLPLVLRYVSETGTDEYIYGNSPQFLCSGYPDTVTVTRKFGGKERMGLGSMQGWMLRLYK
ncbi:hypothetical protein SISNIDRAFT_471484 [Sistotremastrum niveocremeum HHB9708]|uniref:Uncharacterized protein n=1 Tax=Sistotremastrum niveocremeum HHB9708 TaxID=1314777 RepID=A0A164ML30_9AGAM|nr:hypothetical protein SISNIDRAFT_471484 [Sistotremastrum niveocremeum HHB9708]